MLFPIFLVYSLRTSAIHLSEEEIRSLNFPFVFAPYLLSTLFLPAWAV